MVDIRKYTIIITVAILFAIFSYAFADAFTTEAEYPDFCQQSQPNVQTFRSPERDQCENVTEPTQQEIEACPGNLYQNYNSCEYICDCNEITQDNRQLNDRIHFWIGILLGGVAIAVGMLLNPKRKINTWVGSGFILGGVITIFVATAGYWGDLDKILRPIVIAAELALVLWIAYKKFT